VTTIGERFILEVSDPDFRLEQLADITAQAFENFMPWVLGIVISWVNRILSDETAGPVTAVSEQLPALIRYGVGDPGALELVHEGIVGRVAATTISRRYQGLADKPATIREWLRSLPSDEWQRRFAPSILEMRGLLDYARGRGSVLLSDVLDGKIVELEVQSVEGPLVSADATVDDRGGGNVVVSGSDGFTARLRSQDVADVSALLATGIPLHVAIRVTGEEVRLTLEVVPPTPEAAA
jgi:hypothetical protein